MERFITAAKAAEMNSDVVAMVTATHFQSFNMMKLETTDWYVVADDDPRILPMVPIEQLTVESDDDRREADQ